MTYRNGSPIPDDSRWRWFSAGSDVVAICRNCGARRCDVDSVDSCDNCDVPIIRQYPGHMAIDGGDSWLKVLGYETR